MARFVSQYRGYTVGIRAGTAEVRDAGSGQLTRQGTPDLEAKFSHDLMDEEAIKLAKLDRSEGGLANAKPKPDGSMPDAPFHGMQQDESGKLLPIEIRLSLFDSEIAARQNGWSDEDEALVVKTLRQSPNLGTHFVEVVPTPTAKPWPGYDGVTDPEKVIEIVGQIDASLATVLQYEKENQNRPDFVKALTDEIALSEEASVVVSA